MGVLNQERAVQTHEQQVRVTPFDWQRYAQQHGPRAADVGKGNAGARKRRPLTAAELAQRVLAPRWAGIYSRARAASQLTS
jgi:hypothetical protein